MSRYHKLGKIPAKRHVTFKKEDGSLYFEQLISSEGFAHDYSITYHLQRPTRVLEIEKAIDVSPQYVDNDLLVNRSFEGFKVEAKTIFWIVVKPF